MSVREGFVAAFGEDQAAVIEAAARMHKNGIHDRTGSDPFKWALCICIGFECFTAYRDSHGITAPAEEIKAWIREHGGLDTHDGDVDYLALFAGRYQEFIPKYDAAPQTVGDSPSSAEAGDPQRASGLRNE